MLRRTEDELRALEVVYPGMDGQAVQRALFAHLARDFVAAKFAWINHETGEFDYELIEFVDPATATSDPLELRHLFEVKSYGRTIELATAAKFMLVGMRRQPHSITLLTRTRLQPQVLDYARVFFKIAGEPGAPIYPIEFRHVIFDSLDISRRISKHAALVPRAINPGKTRLEWTIYEIGPYAESVVTKTPVMRLREGILYRLVADVRSANADVAIRNGKPIEISIVGDNDFAVTLATKNLTLYEHEDGAFIRFETILTTRACAIPTNLNFKVFISGNLQEQLALGMAEVSTDVDVQDLRPSATRRLRALADAEGVRLLLITGEAGVGKSHLSDRFAANWKRRTNGRAHRFAIAEDSANRLLREISVNLLLPNSLPDDVATVLDHLNVLFSEQGRLDPALPQIELVELAADAALRLGPRLLVFTDCERLDWATADILRQITGAIARRGWHDTRVVLEGRSGADGTPWERLQADLKRRAYTLPFFVEPLTFQETQAWLARKFVAITSDLAMTIFRRTGGVPLHVSALLRTLVSNQTVHQLDSGTLKIVAPAKFEFSGIQHEADEARDGALNTLLLDAFDSRDVPGPFSGLILAGMFAVAETPVRIARMIELLRIGSAELVWLSERMERFDLRAPGFGCALVFRHLRLRELVVNLAASRLKSHPEPMFDRGFGAIETASEAELLGDLSQFFGDEKTANHRYFVAVEIAERAEDYPAVWRVATKGLILLDKLNPGGTAGVLMLLRRAWSAWNCGSTEETRSDYREVLSRLSGGDDPAAPFQSRHDRSEAARRLAGAALEAGDALEACDAAAVAFEEVADVGHFNSILNRLVLLCGRYSLPSQGADWLALASEFVTARDPAVEPEGIAVLCSDAARLLLPANPEIASSILRTGEGYAKGRRQRMWMRMDAVAVDTAIHGKVDTDEVWALRREAVSLGYTNFLLRLDQLLIVDALLNFRLNDAERLIRVNSDRLEIHAQGVHVIGHCNNRIVHALLRNDNALSSEALEASWPLLHSVFYQRASIIQQLPDLFAKARNIAKLQSERTSLAEPLAIFIEESTDWSGSIVPLAFAIRTANGMLGAEISDENRSILDGLLTNDALTTYEAFAMKCGVEVKGRRLGLCVE